jgi:hypothetical protein
MKALIQLAAISLMLPFALMANAQTFYDNTSPAAFHAAYQTADEIADDTPFAGTQHVTSLNFAYINSNPGPVNAVVRFYTVNPNTGFIGSLVASVPVNNLAPGSNAQIVTVNLSPSQQFDWTATPGIYRAQSTVGGFVSFQFSAPNHTVGWLEASGASIDGFYDVTTNQFLTFQGDTSASFYLQLSGSTTTSSTPAATFAPLTLAYGGVLVGASSPARVVQLTNSGNAPLTISGVQASGNLSETDTTCSGQTIAPQSSCTMSVTFTPSIIGSFAGALTITDNAPNSPQLVSVSGVGLPLLTASPSSLTFGTTTLGATSAPKVATLTNNTTGPLSFSPIGSANYSAIGSGIKPCSGTLAAMAKCTMSVTFTPTSNGNINGSLAISSASFPTQLISLTGVGSGGSASPLTFSPTSVTFSSTLAGSVSTGKTVTATNASGSTITITNVVASSGYSVIGSGANPCGGALGSGSSCTVTAGFNPPVAGSFKGSVAFMTGAASTQIFNLTGTGVLPLTFSPSAVTFPAQVVGTTSNSKTLTLVNNRAVPLTISASVSSGQYAVVPGGTNPCGSSIPAHGKCTELVTFSPKQIGTTPGVITVSHSATGSPQEVRLSGIGQ